MSSPICNFTPLPQFYVNNLANLTGSDLPRDAVEDAVKEAKDVVEVNQDV